MPSAADACGNFQGWAALWVSVPYKTSSVVLCSLMPRTLWSNTATPIGSPALQGCGAGVKGPLLFPYQPLPGLPGRGNLKTLSECHPPALEFLVTAHASGCFSPHKPLAAQGAEHRRGWRSSLCCLKLGS